MGKWDGLNRRKFPRVIYPCLVVIRTQGTEASKYMLTHTENVGIGGVCVTLKQSIKMFCPVELEVDLMDFQEHIKCKGKIVWCVRRKGEEKIKPLFYDIGVEFVDLSSQDLERVQEALALIQKNQKESPSF